MTKTAKNELLSRLKSSPNFDQKAITKVLNGVFHEKYPTANRTQRRKLMNAK